MAEQRPIPYLLPFQNHYLESYRLSRQMFHVPLVRPYTRNWTMPVDMFIPIIPTHFRGKHMKGMSMTNFLKNFETGDPVPAGGAAAAYCFCLAVGLINKVVIIESLRKTHCPEIEQNIPTIKKEVANLFKDLEKLIGEDAQNYLEFHQTILTGNKTQKKQSFSSLIDVSMRLIEKGFSALEWIRQLNRVVPEQLQTHLRVSGELIMGAINATIHVVRDNLGRIRSKAKRSAYQARLDSLHTQCTEKYCLVMAEINK
jgi:formiminotetrahydrofolate cyclodeaminase